MFSVAVRQMGLNVIAIGSKQVFLKSTKHNINKIIQQCALTILAKHNINNII